MVRSRKPGDDASRQEELVAYLDGELAPELAVRVEQRLAEDDAYRDELHRLDQAWQALEALPQPTVDDVFARTTMEMVALAAESDVVRQTASLPVVRRKRRLRFALVCFATALFGFLFARSGGLRANRELTANLPVISQVDLYTEIDDLEFLHRLRKMPREFFSKHGVDVGPEVERFQQIVTATVPERMERIAAMPPDTQARLATQATQFAALSEAERRRVAILHQAVLEDDDADALIKTMFVYRQWLSTQSPGEQAELRSASIDERLNLIRGMLRAEFQKDARALSSEDAQVLRDAVIKVVEQNETWRRRLEQARQATQGKLPSGATRDPRFQLPPPLMLMMAFHRVYESMTAEKQAEFIKGVMKDLSPSARRRLQSKPSDRNRFMVRAWVRQALENPESTAALEEFFAEELDNDQREILFSLPPDRWQEKLAELVGIRHHEFDARDSGSDRRGRGGLGDRSGRGMPPLGGDGMPRRRPRELPGRAPPDGRAERPAP